MGRGEAPSPRTFAYVNLLLDPLKSSKFFVCKTFVAAAPQQNFCDGPAPSQAQKFYRKTFVPM
jgi:hypothetical protein